jgi:hypothetical protein
LGDTSISRNSKLNFVIAGASRDYETSFVVAEDRGLFEVWHSDGETKWTIGKHVGAVNLD